MLWLIIFYFLFFLFLAGRNFKLALGLFMVVLPTYLIRFDLFNLPTNLLELSFGAIFLVWIVKYLRSDFLVIKNFIKSNKIFSLLLALFFIASISGILVSDEWYKSLGHWRAFFLEPMLLFIILLGRIKEIKKDFIIWWLGFSTISISLVAILQKFSVAFYPPQLWDEEVFGRATSFFTTPNAIGLYLVPIWVLLFAYFYKNYKVKLKSSAIFYFLFFTLLLGFIAILLSFSQGAWIALGVGILVFMYLLGYKKITSLLVLLGILISVGFVPLRQAILFQDVSGQNRLTIWSYTIDYLTASPQNLVFGTGIRQWFRKVQKENYFAQDNNLERLIFPHNIVLNFWTEIGLLGMLAWGGMMYFMFRFSYFIYKDDKIFGAGLLAMWVAFLIHGLVDVPYFKNDLAFLFWILVSLVMVIHFSLANKNGAIISK